MNEITVSFEHGPEIECTAKDVAKVMEEILPFVRTDVLNNLMRIIDKESPFCPEDKNYLRRTIDELMELKVIIKYN